MDKNYSESLSGRKLCLNKAKMMRFHKKMQVKAEMRFLARMWIVEQTLQQLDDLTYHLVCAKYKQAIFKSNMNTMK